MSSQEHEQLDDGQRKPSTPDQETMDDPPMSVLNPHPVRLDGPSLLHDLVGLDADPNALAIDFLDVKGARRNLTYRELDVYSDRLSRRLRRLQGQRAVDDNESFIIPVLMAQCPELYITILAILKAGGAFCPLPIDVPEERLRFILKDVSARNLVTSPSLSARLPDIRPITTIEIDENALNGGDNGSPSANTIAPTNPAYIMYGLHSNICD